MNTIYPKLIAAICLVTLFVLMIVPESDVFSQTLSQFEQSQDVPGVVQRKKAYLEDPSSVIGGDGDFTVTANNNVINNYTFLAVDAAMGSPAFTVSNVTDLNSSIPQLGPLAVGDLLMIIQMQGASIDTTDSVNYGNVTSLNNSGLYEFVSVGSIVGNTITIDGEGCILGLRNGYTAAGRTQVVRVPQFNNLTINAGASIVPAPWNGSSGGVVVVQVSRIFTLDGSIDVSASGFRGGQLENDSGFIAVTYRSTLSGDGAEKGEGIAGFGPEYDLLNGRYGRGAPANGGGGGNNHKAGGGGGSNGNNTNPWTGQGVMPPTPLAAWQLDPGYVANGNALTNSSGGGRGGYTFSFSEQNALTLGPGNAAWSGDSRREVGGLGGRPLNNNSTSRIFLGGGGGAGDSNNSNGGAGGRGGGLAFVIAGTFTGTGSIFANGQNGFSTTGGGNDAPGGGGGGGTVIISTFGLAGISISASGGSGGNQLITTVEAEGPGGGGGGGYIAARTGALSRIANGGMGGTTTSTALTEFPRNGSTDGATGQSNASVTGIPICIRPSAAFVSIVGRVVTSYGQGIGRASVGFTDSQGITTYASTNHFGYFRFTNATAGQPAIVTVRHKRYQFDNPSQVVTTFDSVTEINFVASQ